MVRAPAHALLRPNGFALLKPVEKPQLDPARILTMSGTIAVNLFALGMLMLPLSLPPTTIAIDEPDEKKLVAREVIREPEVVEIVPTIEPRATTTPEPVAPRVAAATPTETVSTPIATDAGTEYVQATENTSDATSSMDIVDAGPAAMQLEYKLAPAPNYPRRALAQRLTGTVLLQVLVGIDGRPIEVTVMQSSGHRELDEAARAQVLRRWSFQPASRNGQAVQAIGLVPIEFALKD